MQARKIRTVPWTPEKYHSMLCHVKMKMSNFMPEANVIGLDIVNGQWILIADGFSMPVCFIEDIERQRGVVTLEEGHGSAL